MPPIMMNFDGPPIMKDEVRKAVTLMKKGKDAGPDTITVDMIESSRNKSVNYRPLTSVICKLLESIIRDHMMDFLIKHKLINPSQHGFLKAKSCLTNLLCFFGRNNEMGG